MRFLKSPCVSAFLVAVVALFFAETILHCADHSGMIVNGHSHHHGSDELPFSNDCDGDAPAHFADGHSHSAMATQECFRLESHLPFSGMLISPAIIPPPGYIREITLPPRVS